MRDIIESRITIETTLSGNKSSKGALAKNAKLFAIKEDFNPLLDLARSTYQENLGDIMECE
jgi:hypothetical protein